MPHTNYVSYHDPRTQRTRIGHYDLDTKSIQPLSFHSGTPLDNLYQVIEAGCSNITIAGPQIPVSDVKILPPLTGRDVLCVGKNYAEHAKEFNSSGFDSSDKVDVPSHPVIFTKRHTSIIGDGDEIYPHPEFTQTVDYEGEIGVIIGTPGRRIEEKDAMKYVWGFTIVNDVTARERQRDHKQFYLGKSPDTFCPMGPIAVPKENLEQILRVQTRVNGELRQDATTNDLIFSIPTLIKTMSEAQTLMPGDVLATGTPAGVGIGKTPPVYLKPGDEIAISVNGLGTLTNRIMSTNVQNQFPTMPPPKTSITMTNASRSTASTLIQINTKSLYYKRAGSPVGPPAIFVHGLGGSHETFTPLINTMRLGKSHSLHLFDLEGHGLSPTSPLSKVSIESFVSDLYALCTELDDGITIIAHSAGCIIALAFALRYPSKVSKLVLLSPPPLTLPAEYKTALLARAEEARTHEMVSIVDSMIDIAVSSKTHIANPLALAAIRLSILGTDSEGYAKACMAVAEAPEMDLSGIQAHTLIVTGKDDPICPPQLGKLYVELLNYRAGLEVLEGVGHWCVFEDVSGLKNAIGGFLG